MAGLADKAKDFLNSDKGETVSDQGLEKAGDFADQRTGGTHDAQIDKGRDLLDGKIGDQ
ncbi:antitoxin [Modestobacter sp. I12A-02628]|uniref:Antitoxin n=1 Tax=Goekera deserti TaxID=2497753 RepID=A0A7K3WEI1_9ACTN|nr:antitoxin [Goekera deserti]MPQ98521.1 antitoxin [Goekera deserti]NDI48351.1 antitoxin [Goekera deserti]NEL54100.1 antitoxin [Goekera deserti]